MPEFLSPPQLQALQRVVDAARSRSSGVHRELLPDGGEAFAYRHADEICWGINGRDRNLARGAQPLSTAVANGSRLTHRHSFG
jgi:hypothetical protein